MWRGPSVPSRIASLDWLVRPAKSFEVDRAPYSRAAMWRRWVHCGRGSPILGPRSAIPIHSTGGWGQTALFRDAAAYAAFLWRREERDRARDLVQPGITRNLIYAGNFVLPAGAQCSGSFEASQVRTNYLSAAYG